MFLSPPQIRYTMNSLQVLPDVSAIRDFARMIYNKATGDQNRLRYLLLLGDGSYNNISKAHRQFQLYSDLSVGKFIECQHILCI